MDISILLSFFGWAGASATITGYALLTAGRLASTSRLFQGLNIVGSIMLCSSASVNQAWPSAVVNALWALIGVQAWLMLVRKHRRASGKASTEDSGYPPLTLAPATSGPVTDTLILDVIDCRTATRQSLAS